MKIQKGSIMANYGDFQDEIYLAGLRGEQPKFPIDFQELESMAHAMLPRNIYSYVAGGAGTESTQRANVAAFDNWGLVPRMLVSPRQRDMSIELFGMRLPTPLFLCPIGVVGLCAQDGHGDLATARAAALTGVPMIVLRRYRSIRWKMLPGNLARLPDSFSSTHQLSDLSPRVSFGVPKPPASRRSSSRSTHG
jgi:FMN-dependent dehydrogenase